jgi:hypothetical protein
MDLINNIVKDYIFYVFHEIKDNYKHWNNSLYFYDLLSTKKIINIIQYCNDNDNKYNKL